jgi:ATP-dependent DNA helicase RecG
MGNEQPSVRRSQSAAEESPLHQPVQYVKGVGPRRAELLRRLGVETVADLLFFFPRTYEDISDVRNVSKLEEGRLQSVIGVIEDIDSRVTRSGQTVVGMAVACEDGYVRALWFQQPYRRDLFRVGQQIGRAHV